VIELGIVTDVRPELRNALVPIVLSPSVNVTEVSFEQLWNELKPHVVTELGIITDVRTELWNALVPIVVSPSDNVTEFSVEQFKNAESLILVTLYVTLYVIFVFVFVYG
jgi:hypothetical protein